MYNARLVERRSPGQPLEPTGYPEKPVDIEHNAVLLLPLIDAATSEELFAYGTSAGNRTYPAHHTVVGHGELLEMLEQLRWLPSDHFAADLTWLQDLTSDQIEDWAVLLPQHAGAGPRATIDGRGPLSVFRRQRRRAPQFGAISDPKHRHAPLRIAGVGEDLGDAATEALRAPRRGAVLIYPVVELPADADVAEELPLSRTIVAMVLVAPESTGSPDGALVRFVVRDKSRENEPIVEAE